MRGWGNFLVALAFSLVAGAAAVGTPGPAAAQGAVPDISALLTEKGFGLYRVVRIDPGGVFPKQLRVAPGTTVIWLNATRSYSAVVFNQGEALTKGTRSPTLFYMAPDGTYVSVSFAPGATSSIAFVTPGRYPYFVTGLPTQEGAAFGTVVVE